jgi:hypothetical protein
METLVVNAASASVQCQTVVTLGESDLKATSRILNRLYPVLIKLVSLFADGINRMRTSLLLLVISGVVVAQPRVLKDVVVQPGTAADIALSVPAPQPGDAFDILSSYADAEITVVLPDGKQLDLGAAQEGPVLEAISAEEIREVGSSLKNLMIVGPGQHWSLGLGNKPQAGIYHVHVSGLRAGTPFRVRIAPIDITEILKALLRKIPGTRIFDSVKVPAGTKGASIPFSLSRDAGGVLIDVAAADPRALIRLQLPDGTAVTQENSKEHGIEWMRTPWPPAPIGDDFGFGAIFMLMTMLPVRGTHHTISFTNEAPVTGRYAIEAVAVDNHPTEVSAMLISVPRLEKQLTSDLDNFGVKPGETLAMGYGYSGPIPFVGDRIPLAIRLRGEPVREPVQFHTHAFLMRYDGPATNLDLPINFVRDTGNFYRGVFIPQEPGVYTISAEVTGRQKSGHAFSAMAGLDSLDVHPLVAKLTGLVERAANSKGAGKPDRLQVTANVEVFDPGPYELSVVLKDNKFAQLTESYKAVLARGTQQISASIGAARIISRFDSDGPYRVSVSLDRVPEGEARSTADVRAGNDLATAAYKLEDWQPTGAGVDLKGDGKFQIYRVPWEVVTPGGDCAWSGYISPKGSNQSSQPFSGHARLAPGTVTLDLDLDGYWIKRSGSPHAWWAAMDMQCDGKKINFAGDSSRFMLRTPVLRPEDFEPRPADFGIKQSGTQVELRPGGPQRSVHLEIQPIGQLEGPLTLQFAAPAFLRTSADKFPEPPFSRSGSIYFYAATEAQPGEYPIQVTASAAGVQHAITVRVIVDAPPAPPVLPPAPSPPRPPARVGVRVAARRSVALIVGINGAMNNLGCDAMKQIARNVAERLQARQDALSFVEAGGPINVTIPMTTDFSAALPNAMDHLAQVRCGGTSNMAYAIEKAEEQLSREDRRDTVRSVVLFMAGLPTALTAKWPMRAQADSRMKADSRTQPALFVQLQGEAVVPPSGCADLQGRRYPDPEWATGDSMPDRTGVLRFTSEGQVIGPLGPSEVSATAVLPAEAPVDKGCAFLAPDASYVPMHRDLAYVPDTDLMGVPLEGTEPLVRFDQGPYRGKIRPDVPENVRAIQRNLFDNSLQRLSNAGIRVVVVWMNRFTDPTGFRSTPSRTLITIHHEEQIPQGMEQVLAAIAGAAR